MWKLTVDAGTVPQPTSFHSISRDQVFFVLSGSIQIRPDADQLCEGDMAVVSKGELIGVVNPTDLPAEVLIVTVMPFSAVVAGKDYGTPAWAQ